MFDITDTIFNDRTKVWFVDPRIDGRKIYGRKVGVENIDIKKHSIELTLLELLTRTPGTDSCLLSIFEPATDVHITNCECGDPSHYANNESILTLKNCSFVESWINDPVILSPDKAHSIVVHLIVESWDYVWAER